MLGLLEHVVLGDCVSHFILLYDHVFFQNLHSVQFPGAFLAAQHHLSEGAFAQHFDEFKLLQRLWRL